MGLDDLRERRVRPNARMAEADDFFREFGVLDDGVYAGGAIPKKHKEMMGLAISVATRCDGCVLYHLDGCRREGASRAQVVEAVEIGVLAGGSITYPTARFAFEALEALEPWRAEAGG